MCIRDRFILKQFIHRRKNEITEYMLCNQAQGGMRLLRFLPGAVCHDLLLGSLQCLASCTTQAVDIMYQVDLYQLVGGFLYAFCINNTD